MREALRQIAYQASATARDETKSWWSRLAALLVMLACVNQWAAICAIILGVMAYNIKSQNERCMKSDAEAREERRQLHDAAEKGMMLLEERMTLREERNTLGIVNELKNVGRSVDRMYDAMSGKQFIPRTPAKKVEPKDLEKKP